MSSPLVFVSAAPEDQAHVRQLLIHLDPLAKTGQMALWHRGLLRTGLPVHEQTRAQLGKAAAVVLLLSPDYFADPISEEDIRLALDRQRAGAAVVPVLLRSVATLDLTPLAGLQILPRDGRPLATWDDTDEAWVQVIQELRQLLHLPPPVPHPTNRRWVLVASLALAGAAGGGIVAYRHGSTPAGPSAQAPTRAPTPSTATAGAGAAPAPVRAVASSPIVGTTPPRPSPAVTGHASSDPATPTQAPKSAARSAPLSAAAAPPAPLSAAAARPSSQSGSAARPAPLSGSATPEGNGRYQLLGFPSTTPPTDRVCLKAPETAELEGRAEPCTLDPDTDPPRCTRRSPHTTDIPLRGTVTWHLPCPR